MTVNEIADATGIPEYPIVKQAVEGMTDKGLLEARSMHRKTRAGRPAYCYIRVCRTPPIGKGGTHAR